MLKETPFSVIKFDEDQENKILVHRSEITDFNIGSVLVVNDSQQAILFKDGVAEGPFPGGRHILTTNNIPTFREKFARFFSFGKEKLEDRVTPFTCEVFFINMVSDLPLFWGTPNPIQLEDPKYNILLSVGARGNTKIRVIDPMRFVLSVCGQIKDYSIDRVKASIKADMLPIVSTLISQTITRKQVSILEINNNIIELSQDVLKELNLRLKDFGLEALHFNIEAIEADEKDLAKLRETKEKYLEAMTDINIEAMKTTRLAAARAEGRRMEGYTYQQERQFDVLNSAASNEGSAGNIMGATMGMGMGFGLGGVMGNAMSNASTVMANNMVTCANCGASVNAGGKFCPSCGAQMQAPKKVCPNCNAEVAIDSKFCPSCGTSLAEKTHCPACGEKLQPGAKFCPNCGEKI